KILENYIYNTDPTKLTKQIEKITRYDIRKQNLEDEINKLEKSEQNNKERLIEKLKKRDTLGSVKFDSVVISDFDESLKSVTTSLLYTDISPKEKYFITLNQWFDESLLKEISLQPLYFPSANKSNYDEFSNEYFEKYNQYPNQLSFLSYDLVGLVYYLILQNNSVVNKKMFKKKNLFKGKVGIFEIKNNKINHILNFYKVEDGEFKKVF
ncbi:penicillin-binding protein activator, partial [Candidatus Pelagibacter sp.]|nr:penicillin-binding protein activator [Candidatus Pelagibacter sp.]